MARKPGQLKEEKRDAFEALVREYEAPLLRYSVRLLRDPDAAQDVVQQAFIRLLTRWKDEWLPSPQMASWLYRVAHNCAIDHIRKESRRRRLHEAESEGRPEAVPPNRGAGFRLSEGAELAAEALKALPARDQQVVILRVYEDMSYKAISAITGLTVTNVGYILHHAMKALAEEVKRLKANSPQGDSIP